MANPATKRPAPQPGDGYVFRIKVVPGSSCNRVEGFEGDMVKVKVTKPAHKGQANEACLKLLAGMLGVRTSDMELMHGGGCAWKTLRVRGCARPPLEILLGPESGADAAAKA